VTTDFRLERALFFYAKWRELPRGKFAPWCRRNGHSVSQSYKLAKIGKSASPKKALAKVRKSAAERQRRYHERCRKLIEIGRKVSRDAKA
jgi:cytidylate kinase